MQAGDEHHEQGEQLGATPAEAPVEPQPSVLGYLRSACRAVCSPFRSQMPKAIGGVIVGKGCVFGCWSPTGPVSFGTAEKEQPCQSAIALPGFGTGFFWQSGVCVGLCEPPGTYWDLLFFLSTSFHLWLPAPVPANWPHPLQAS